MSNAPETLAAFSAFESLASQAKNDRSKLVQMGAAFQQLLAIAGVHKSDLFVIGINKATIDRWWCGATAPHAPSIELLRQYFFPIEIHAGLSAGQLLSPHYTPLLEVLLEDVKKATPAIEKERLGKLIQLMNDGVGTFSKDVIKSFFGIM